MESRNTRSSKRKWDGSVAGSAVPVKCHRHRETLPEPQSPKPPLVQKEKDASASAISVENRTKLNAKNKADTCKGEVKTNSADCFAGKTDSISDSTDTSNNTFVVGNAKSPAPPDISKQPGKRPLRAHTKLKSISSCAGTSGSRSETESSYSQIHSSVSAGSPIDVAGQTAVLKSGYFVDTRKLRQPKVECGKRTTRKQVIGKGGSTAERSPCILESSVNGSQSEVHGDHKTSRSSSSDSGFQEIEKDTAVLLSSSSIQNLATQKTVFADHPGLPEFDFQDRIVQTYECKPHIWPRQHDQSRNVFHYASNSTLGRLSFLNKQAAVTSQILSRVADFEVVDGDQPFNCRVTTIDWHPRIDNFICIGSKHGDLAFYKVEDDTKLKGQKTYEGIGPGGYIAAFKFHPTNDEMYYTASLDGKVCIGNTTKAEHPDGVFLNTFSWEHWFCSLDAHQTDNMIVAGKNNGWTTLMSRTGETIWEKRLHKNKVSHLEFSPREPFLMCSASLDHTVRMWDLRMVVEKKPMAFLQHQKGVNSAYFSLTDGTRIVTTDQGDEISVYRSPYWHQEQCIKHPHRFFQHITPIKAYWHPLCDYILCGRFPDDRNHPDFGSRRTMDMYDAGSGRMCFELKDRLYNGIVSLCKFNRGGDKLLSAMGYNFHVWSHRGRTDDDRWSGGQGNRSSSEKYTSGSDFDISSGRDRQSGSAATRKKLKSGKVCPSKTSTKRKEKERNFKLHVKSVQEKGENSGAKNSTLGKKNKKPKKDR